MAVWLERADSQLLESLELADWVRSGDVQGVASLDLLAADSASLPRRAVGLVRPAAQVGHPDEAILDRWTTHLVRGYADVLVPVYEGTNGEAGYVSFDVHPLGDVDLAGLLEAVRRLWSQVNRPNVMVRIPAGEAGVQALEIATLEGINTHLYGVASLDRYAEASAAFVRSLEKRVQEGMAVNHLASVVSVDLAQWGADVRRRLRDDRREGGRGRPQDLEVRVPVALARLVLAQQRAAFVGAGFAQLQGRGAHAQKAVLIGLTASEVERGGGAPPPVPDDVILGMESAELARVASGDLHPPRLEGDLAAARAELEALELGGPALAEVEQELESEGTARVRREQRRVMAAVKRTSRLASRELGVLQPHVAALVERLTDGGVAGRIWSHDVSLWAAGGPGAEEAAKRLGWLTLPERTPSQVDDLVHSARSVANEGWTDVVLMGMGGSSLATDVLRRILAQEGAGLRMHVLDTTDPDAVRWVTRRAPVQSTLYLVSSKSGTTAEPLALLSHFWALAEAALGSEAGRHFIALTDPDTPLQALGEDRGFREVVTTPADVGGRYSALSPFGMLPAALMDLDVRGLIRGGSQMARACGPTPRGVDNPGLFLGAVLAAAAEQGRDKLTLLFDPGLEPLGDWIEQLVAESTGKDGMGILPIVGEPAGPGRVYGEDRILIYLRHDGSLDGRKRGWLRAGIPTCVLEVDPRAEGLGAEFFRWEFATAVASHGLGVNAFNQPDVQRAKSRTIDLLKAYRRSGALPELPLVWEGEGLSVRGQRGIASLDSISRRSQALGPILDQVKSRHALVILAYTRPTATLDRVAAAMRRNLRERRGLVTTFGYGPRYLHSTGQLHKGGPDRLAFLIVTCDPARDLPVPEADYSFGTLERAQAIGDLQALLALGRRAYGLHVRSPSDVRKLLAELGRA